MSYEQDFAKEFLRRYGVPGMFIGLLAFGVVLLALYILKAEDEELKVELSYREYGFLTVVCILGAVYILYRQQGTWMASLRGFVMLLYLVLCCVTDYCTQQVYDLIQLGVCIVISVSALLGQAQPTQGTELIVFALVQVLVFRKMYGEADVMCFLICALSLVERGILLWTCHMGISFLLLGLVQGIKRNISEDGNLKVPVAFFPYMAVAYILVF